MLFVHGVLNSHTGVEGKGLQVFTEHLRSTVEQCELNQGWADVSARAQSQQERERTGIKPERITFRQALPCGNAIIWALRQGPKGPGTHSTPLVGSRFSAAGFTGVIAILVPVLKGTSGLSYVTLRPQGLSLRRTTQSRMQEVLQVGKTPSLRVPQPCAFRVSGCRVGSTEQRVSEAGRAARLWELRRAVMARAGGAAHPAVPCRGGLPLNSSGCPGIW